MLTKKYKYIIILFFLLIFAISVFVISWRLSSIGWRRSQTLGTVKALNAAIYSELTHNQQLFEDVLVSKDDKWQTVPRNICNKLIMNLSDKYNLDTPVNWTPSEPLLDFWGQHIEIKHRRTSSGEAEFKVVSAGPDCVFNTEDDINSN